MRALLFPGQGAQFVGMGKALYQSSVEAARLFDLADEILGFGLREIMFEGTEEELKQTHITQPALFVHSMATMAAIGDLPYDFLAGHSLGELSAMSAGGVFDFETGLHIVRHRALAMQSDCDSNPSTMAAIVGLPDEIVEESCAVSNKIVVPANYNCPGQLVISGSLEGVRETVELLKSKGAKMAVELQVAGAFHSPLMADAAESFGRFVSDIEFQQPKVPIVQNAVAAPVLDPEELKENLIKQLVSPVRWTQSMQTLIAMGVNQIVEVGGNGKVLRGLMRRIDRKVEAIQVETFL